MYNDKSMSYNKRDMNESDPRSDVHYLGSSENKAWFQALFSLLPK